MMDSIINSFIAEHDADLALCIEKGVAYQIDMATQKITYGNYYLEKVESYAGSKIATRVNGGRCAMLMRILPDGASVLDVGSGSGEFVRTAASWGFDVCGFDVIPEGAQRMRDAGTYAEDLSVFDAVTMWDSIEHMENPGKALSEIRRGAFLFVSVPIFSDLKAIRESKHYRPGEHLYYFSADGFVSWMELQGFRLLERSSHETDAGRENIGAFAFCRDIDVSIQPAKEENIKQRPACPCGGESQLEYFDHPKKSIEWFLRCIKCGNMSDAVATPEDADSLVIEAPQ